MQNEETPLNILRKLKKDGQRKEIITLTTELALIGYPKSLLKEFTTEAIHDEDLHPYVYEWHEKTRNLKPINSSPLVSIIIVSYNSSRDLLRLLPTLISQSYTNWELVLIENGTEDSLSVAKQFLKEVRYIKADNPGFSEANNIGLENSNGELLLLLNPDTKLQEETLRELVHGLCIDSEAAASCPRIFFYSPFYKLTISSAENKPFCVDLAPTLEISRYRKYFVRKGTRSSGSIIESDKDHKVTVDIALNKEAENISLNMWIKSSKIECTDIAIDFEGSGERPRIITIAPSHNLYELKLSKQVHSASRYLLNNCGSGIREKSKEVFDIGFGEVDQGQYSARAYRDAFCGCCVLLRRDLFVKRKIFISEFFAYYEDSELSYWINSNRMRILYVPSAIMYHKHSESTVEGSEKWSLLVNRSSNIYNQIAAFSGERPINTAGKDYSKIGEKTGHELQNKLSEYDHSIEGRRPYEIISRDTISTIGIYNSYWSSMGGGEKHSLDIACLAKKHGHEVYLLSEQDFSIEDLASYYHLDLRGIKKLISSAISESLTQRFDIFVNSTYRSSLISRARRSYYIVSFPHEEVDKEFIESYLFAHNSSYTKAWAERYWGSHQNVVINPVLGFTHNGAAKPGEKKNSEKSVQKEKILLTVGRFNYAGHCKNQHLIANAFKELTSNGIIPSDWKLAIAGSVNEMDRLSTRHLQEVEKSLTGCNAEIFPNASREKIAELYEKASIYIHATGLLADPSINPEKFEHFGISVFEALVNGCVPVVHQTGGPAEQASMLKDPFLFSNIKDFPLAILKAINFIELQTIQDRANMISNVEECAGKLLKASITEATRLLEIKAKKATL